MISVRLSFRNPAAILALCAVVCTAATGAESKLQQAIRLYDAGRYAESKPLLEQIVAAGDADGVTLYRLYFCQRSTNDPAHAQTLARARVLLEKEVAEAAGFESAFYLSNTYANLGRTADVPRIAFAVTTRFEAGEIAAPTTAVEQFRLGKLYADQSNDLAASPWFEKAVDGFEASGDATFGPYLEWGARWLGTRAMEEERFEAAAKQLARVCGGPNPNLEDLDKLGLANLIIGNYDAAKNAWQHATRLSPTAADRFRYGAGLAELAKATQDVPLSPDGERGWNELSREELDKILADQAQIVRDAKTEADAIETLTAEQRTTLSENGNLHNSRITRTISLPRLLSSRR